MHDILDSSANCRPLQRTKTVKENGLLYSTSFHAMLYSRVCQIYNWSEKHAFDNRVKRPWGLSTNEDPLSTGPDYWSNFINK